jgi:hypothetical protein
MSAVCPAVLNECVIGLKQVQILQNRALINDVVGLPHESSSLIEVERSAGACQATPHRLRTHARSFKRHAGRTAHKIRLQR